MADPTPPDETPAVPEERVFVTDKYGRKFSVPASQAQQAAAQGYTPESADDKRERELQAKYGDTTGEVKAGVAGAARGVSFGLSDLALTKTGLVNPETLAGLKEANPVSSLVGEGAGIAAGLLIPGGAAGVAAKAGGSVARLAGEGVGARLIGEGVAGSLFGLGNTVTEASLGDTELNAQKLAAGAGSGFLMGVLGGAGGEVVGAAAKRLAQPISDALAAAPEQMQQFAAGRALKAAGFSKATLKKLGNSETDILDGGQTLLDHNLIAPGDKPADVLAKVSQKADQVGDSIGSALKSVDDAGHKFDMRAFVDRARQQLVGPLSNDPAHEAEAKALARLLDGYEQNGADSFVEANKLKSGLGKKIRKWDPTDPIGAERRQLYGIFNDEIESQVGNKGGADLAKSFRDDKRLYKVLLASEQAGDSGVRAELGNRYLSPSDQGIGVGAAIMHGGGPAGMALGLGSALVNKVARERLPSTLAWTMDRLAKSPVFDSLANGFSTFAKKQMENAPGLLGEFTPILANALARSPSEALLTHAHLSARQDDVGQRYRDAMTQAGLDYSEDGNAAHSQAVGLSALQLQLQKHDATMDDAIHGAVNGQGTGLSSGPLRSALLGDSLSGPLKTWQERTRALQKLADNPGLLTDRIAAGLGPLQGIAPQLATSLSTTMANAVQFLNSKVPKPGDNPTGQVKALARPFEPSDMQKKSFERYVAAVQDPKSVFDGLAHGQVTREAVEALKSVYPSLLTDLQQRTLNVLSTRPESLPLAQRVALSRLLDMPCDPSMQPQKLAQLQQNHSSPSGGPPSGAPGGGRSLKPGKPSYTGPQAQQDETFRH